MSEPYIQYCPHHIKSGASIQQIPISNVKEVLGFEYKYAPLDQEVKSCMDLVAKSKYKQAILLNHIAYVNKQNDPFCHEFKVLENPEQTLVVHVASPKIGKGLVSLKHIPKCTIILSYEGKMISNFDSTDNVYTTNNGYSKEKLAPFLAKVKAAKDNSTEQINAINKYFEKSAEGIDEPLPGITTIKIDAKDEGNIARFSNHLPLSPMKHLGYNVLTANLFSRFLPSLDGFIKCFLVTARDIEAEEELGWFYGYTYGHKSIGYFENKTSLPIVSKGVLHNPSYDYIPEQDIDNLSGEQIEMFMTQVL